MKTFNRPLGPFAILYEPRATPKDCKPPAKRGPKNKKAQMLSALMTDAERKQASILKDNTASHFNVHIPTIAGGDRTACIFWRGI